VWQRSVKKKLNKKKEKNNTADQEKKSYWHDNFLHNPGGLSYGLYSENKNIQK
jgi:hypothetical protein